MKNWRRNLLPAGVCLALLCLIMLALPVYGQFATGCPDGVDCMNASTFDTDTNGWVPAIAQTTLTWMPYKRLGTASDAAGVLMARGSGSIMTPDYPSIRKTIYLQPGYYQVVMRAGEDFNLLSRNTSTIKVWSGPDFTMSYGELSPWYYKEVRSHIITIAQPTSVIIEIVNTNTVYYDWIYIERRNETLATPTPGATRTPGGPTPAPSATPIPIGQQATPAPPGTAVCTNATPTPPGTFVTSTVTITTVSRLETFYGLDLYSEMGSWNILGDVVKSFSADHTGDVSGSAKLYYDNAPVQNALVLPVDYTDTWYVNAWAQADVVPTGGTAYMEIWKLDGTWSRVAQVAIGAQQWYPLHAEITGAPTAIAFVATRSDNPSPGSGYAYLDDVYAYAPESNMPYCSSQYPTGTSTTIIYPGNKPCPPGIMQPNNIWGMLLAQLTLFLDEQMAWAPAHVLGTTRDLAQQFMLGPVGGLITLATLVFDWQIPITMLEIYLAFQAGLAIIGIWKTIRRAFIV